MSGALWWLWAPAILLLLAVVAVLATPVKLGVTISLSPRWRLQVALRLLGGLTPPIQIHDSARRSERRRASKPRRRKPARAASGRFPRGVLAAPRLLLDLLRPIRLERLRLDADIGLEDPADTGQLFGLLAAATYSAPPNPAVSIAVRPDFSGPRASGEAEAVMRFTPLALVPPGVRIAWRMFGARR